MQEQDNLEQEFKARLRSGMRHSAEIDGFGIVLGAGTYLTRFAGKEPLAQNGSNDRLLALLSIAHWQRPPAHLLKSITAACDDWHRGEKALAHIRLLQAGLPQLGDADDAYCLFLAEALLDGGMQPPTLMKALGFEPEEFAKYDRNQPRVPAGNGRESGRWGSGSGGSSGATDKPDPYRVTVTEARTTSQVMQPPSVAPAFVAPTVAASVGATAAEGLFAAGERVAF